MSEADDKMVLNAVVRTVDGQKLPVQLIKSAVARAALRLLQLERDKERLEELLKLRRATAALSAELERKKLWHATYDATLPFVLSWVDGEPNGQGNVFRRLNVDEAHLFACDMANRAHGPLNPQPEQHHEIEVSR